jgi:MarR family transcriptional regulator, transcriptional regulator for hemolysin
MQKIWLVQIYFVKFVQSIVDISNMSTELENVLLFVIDQTSKVAKQHSQREFDLLGLGITVEQWVLLKVIEEKSVLSQTELAKETYRDPASITRTLDLLQRKGLIIREPIIDNRRQYNIKLTNDGNAFVVQNMPLIRTLRNLSIKDFSEAEVEALISMLRRVQKNME